MNDADFNLFVFKVLEHMRMNAQFPRDTGNLAENAMQKWDISPSIKSIKIDKEVADYVDFLENGTPNSDKHIGFWEKVVEAAISAITAEFGGTIL